MPADALLTAPAATARLPTAARWRIVLLAATGAALAGSATLGCPVELETDLVRLLRFMALMKGCFAIAALVICLWRLARPVSGWRGAIYGLAPALMFGG